MAIIGIACLMCLAGCDLSGYLEKKAPEDVACAKAHFELLRDHPGMPFGFPPEQAFSFAGIPNHRRRADFPFFHCLEPARLVTRRGSGTT